MAGEPTDFLYPFIEAGERDASSLLDDLAASAAAKRAQSDALRAATVEAHRDEVARGGQAVADRLGRGGVLYAFGNGGSATDALRLAAELGRPASGGRPLAARALVAEPAVLTALANDIGVDVVFSRQLIAHDAGPGDVAVALSTSGGSANVLAAVAEARRRGMLTVGFAGYDGGELAAAGHLDHCFVVHSDSVHRIQEAQSALTHALVRAVHAALADRADPDALGAAGGHRAEAS